MFTGIITGVGQITTVTPLGHEGDKDSGVRVHINANGFDLSRTKLGDSIAIQGACMTVVAFDEKSFEVEVSRESLNKTVGLDRIGEVNLEHAMRLGDSLDGHIVAGHVDGKGLVNSFQPVGESHELKLEIPAALSKYLAYKGSVVVNGVSLTVNSVHDLPSGGCEISINLIPHTLEVTTLKHLQKGAEVNIEVDLLARYVERILSLSPSDGAIDIHEKAFFNCRS
ncbi:riboflavin synthase [Oligella urethralis]|uniref:riboflavin synthase n=1 Tax=Oligella urethralis TaxID=90245 RepID=UPI000368F9DB|nr:riboflavin synthase [Oligella urethralis]SUA63786.1 Riboflavin synthase alpha chain [Oligella urethralis]